MPRSKHFILTWLKQFRYTPWQSLSHLIAWLMSISLLLFIFFCTIYEAISDLPIKYVGIPHEHHFHVLHDFSFIILTIILIGVAWSQLHHLNETSKDDFLMRIDQRFGSRSIIKARAMIHEMYLKTKDCCEDTKIEIISKKIIIIYKNEKETEKFMQLLNFLDLLETIAYFCNRDEIKKEDVRELLGNSIEFYYRVYKSWIAEYRWVKQNGSCYYRELKEFVENNYINKM